MTVLLVYAPQAGLDDSLKILFYKNLRWTMTKISASEILFACGDFNGHIGINADGYEELHDGTGFGRHNLEGERILKFAVAQNLVVSNSRFTKRVSHLVTYQSGKNQNQIDYILVKRQNTKSLSDVKVIPNDECVTQHKLCCKNCKN